MNYFQELAQNFGQQLIRPRKYNYSEQILQHFFIDHPQFKYQFNKVQNKRHQLLQTLLIKNTIENYPDVLLKNKNCNKVCIIYAHGLGSNKLQVLPILKHFKNYSYDICSFDFSGSGKSEGNYTSYGLREQDDISAILTWLDEKQIYDQYVLWGRSMGSVAIILSQGVLLNEKVKCIVIDSPFSSFQKVSLEIASKKSCIPQLFLQPLINYLKQYFARSIQFNPFKMDIVQKIKKIDRKILFIYSKNDSIVHYSHSTKLKLNCRHIPHQIQINQDHNMQRSKQTYLNIYHFIQNNIRIQKLCFESAIIKKQNFDQTIDLQSVTTRGKSQNRNRGISLTTKQVLKQNSQNQINGWRKSTGSSNKNSKINLVITQSLTLQRKDSMRTSQNNRPIKFKPVSSVQYNKSCLNNQTSNKQNRNANFQRKFNLEDSLNFISLNSIDTIESNHQNEQKLGKYTQKRQKKGAFINLVKKQHNFIDFDITQKLGSQLKSCILTNNSQQGCIASKFQNDFIRQYKKQENDNIHHVYSSINSEIRKQKAKSFYSAPFMDQNLNMLCSINSICLNKKKFKQKQVTTKQKSPNINLKRPSIQLRRKNRFVI